MLLRKELRSPKIDRSWNKRSAISYHYYAGFSPEFVRDVVNSLDINRDAVILDPWNGSGTTTQVAKLMGYSAIGFDINPAMVIVAKARLLDCTSVVRKNISENIETLIGMASGFNVNRFLDEDPLESWLESESATCFRNIERAIQLLLISDRYNSIYINKSIGHISDVASFFYLALFKTLRRFLASYVSSNPTWIKMPSTKKTRIHPTSEEIYKEFKNQVHEMIDVVNFENMEREWDNSASIQIECASSEMIPLPNSSIDLVVSSPPYCTRIDYAIATSPELALLGCSMGRDIRSLRDRMIGTPTIANEILEAKSTWGQTCGFFLKAVETHKSKASKSYYYRYHVQYFDAIYRSLLEIDRVLAELGKCVIVVQDSYYKEIHNDLPTIFCEMADSLDWVPLDRLDFHIKRTMAGRNNRVKKYRVDSKATESVLIFKKKANREES
jgi:DNA modification methylase